MAKVVVGRLTKIWKDRQISRAIKNRLVNCFVLPILTYGCDSWTLRQAERSTEVLEDEMPWNGLPVGKDTLYTLLFADDQVLIAVDRDDSSYMFRKLHEEYSKWGLTINSKKTEYMVVGDDEREDLDVGIESITTYGADTWELNKVEKNKWLSLEMDFWQRSCRISRLEHISNQRIREIIGEKETILDAIDGKILSWYGHLQRMDDNRWPKRIHSWTPSERRKRGRPPRRWKQGVVDAMNSRGLQEKDWTDRNLWKLRATVYIINVANKKKEQNGALY
ncbi:uncharacterized protein LOC115891711 [Sitophilus oryzae]|uniref:Uncharacterized protein LOC115891711 n=1 Tax=Sitophilus oryzae TaxID=7048 RepID=A0A6J2YXY8_SITOR|nr:uncharacterized protein LOC115891711 [Sitophilus oryzae]